MIENSSFNLECGTYGYNFTQVINLLHQAQIKRKTGRGGEETEEDEGRQEKESEYQEAAPSPPLLSSSPRAAAHLAGAARVLPPLGGTDGG